MGMNSADTAAAVAMVSYGQKLLVSQSALDKCQSVLPWALGVEHFIILGEEQ